jgi:hypothetical protein
MSSELSSGDAATVAFGPSRAGKYLSGFCLASFVLLLIARPG